MKSLKTEEVYLWEYRTLEDVQDRRPYFIEEMYYRKQLLSALGYRCPNEFGEHWILAEKEHQPSWTATQTQSVQT
jgi:putative transposase